jgi:sec-independent protein translocase protein TatA
MKMGNIGVPELIIIFVVALIVFGPKKLPELGKSLGKGLAEFRRASNELKASLEEEVRSIEHEPPPASSPVPIGTISSTTPTETPTETAVAEKSTPEKSSDVH